MLKANVIDLAVLEQYFKEVLPKMESFSLRSDPDRFKRKFGLLKKRISDSKET